MIFPQKYFTRFRLQNQGKNKFYCIIWDYKGVEYHSLFDDAIGHYKIASDNLKKVSELFPCFSVTEDQRVANVKDKNLCHEAIEHLKVARDAETAGLKYLEKNS